MAERRMFAKTIIDSDAFLEMPLSSQALYFHLSMRADDDGFVNNPKRIQRLVGANENDLGMLIAKHFLIPFESGIVVIKHWRIHNYIQNDRYKKTVYTDEKALLDIKSNKAYTFKNDLCIQDEEDMYPECIQDVSKMDTQVRLGKVRLDKDRLVEGSIGEISVEEQTTAPTTTKHGEHYLITLTPAEYQGLINLYGEQTVNFTIGKMDNWLYENNRRYSNCYSKIIDWIEGDKKRESQQPRPSKSTFNNFDQRTDNDFDDLAHNAAQAQKEAWKKRKGGNQ